MTDQVIVDCSTAWADGAVQVVALTPQQVQDLQQQQTAAAQEAAKRAAEGAWRQLQLSALAGVSAALHDPTASGDAASLAALVHKLTADPVQPLSAPEMCALVRFVLRALLP